MKGKVLFVAAAISALSCTPALAQGAFNWQGFYAGINVGYGWGDSETQVRPLPDAATFGDLQARTTLNPEPDGFVGGATAGYNWQQDLWVFGLETDFQLSGMRGADHESSIIQNGGGLFPTGSLKSSEDVNWFGTVRARLGYVPDDGSLLYVTGGYAYAGVDYSADADFRPTNLEHYPKSLSKTKSGWTAGAGFEWATDPLWTFKLEYLYVDLGDESADADPSVPTPPLLVNYDWETMAHIVRAGVNFKLD